VLRQLHLLQTPLQRRRPGGNATIMVRRHTLVEAAELFNATQFRRTIAGVGRALGEAKASIIPLSGVNAEVVLTFGWDLSWYQYRVSPESAQPVRIAERGQDLSELDPGYREWNATVTEDGRIVPNIERL
jgi:hypothetical protein